MSFLRQRGCLALAFFCLTLFAGVGAAAPLQAAAPTTAATAATPATDAKAWTPLLGDLEQRTFRFFWDTANPDNGLVPDHWPTESFSSIAAVGFALTGYGIGVHRGYITRAQAVQRTLATLRFFVNAPQNDSEDDATGYHGFFYHFLDMHTGLRTARWTEVSSVDTSLLLGGVLFAQSFYDRDTPDEKVIRALADKIYRRVDWNWLQVRSPLIGMGWTPGGKFIPYDWKGYNEAMLVYVLALGSPTHAVRPDAWTAWTKTYALTWGEFEGQTYLGFGPMFGHQYSQAWIDFRGIRDAYMRKHGLDYFENSRRAAYAQRAYAIANPLKRTGYGANIWGLTASNGPADITWVHYDKTIRFYGYTARGVGIKYSVDDGTLAPTAAAASIAFAPDIAIPAIQALHDKYGKYIYSKYGFLDAFNPTFQAKGVTLRSGKVIPGHGWVDNEYLGIDQGPILLMLENYRDGFVWKVMRRNPYIRRGLERAGFTGGWLDSPAPTTVAPRVRTVQPEPVLP